jgi:hypothetical protein
MCMHSFWVGPSQACRLFIEHFPCFATKDRLGGLFFGAMCLDALTSVAATTYITNQRVIKRV